MGFGPPPWKSGSKLLSTESSDPQHYWDCPKGSPSFIAPRDEKSGAFIGMVRRECPDSGGLASGAPSRAGSALG